MKICRIRLRQLSMGAICGVAIAANGVDASTSELSSQQIGIPAEWGHVIDSIEGPSNRQVVLIKDAHGNYTAQKNIANLLDYLRKVYEIQLVMVEGGEGNADLDFLRKEGTQSARKAVAEDLLRQGVITGQEYWNLISEEDFQLWAVENSALYEANLSAYEKLQEISPLAVQDFNEVQKLLSQLELQILNQELLNWRQTRRSYESGELALFDYVERILSLFDASENVLISFPQIAGFIASQNINPDASQVQLQRNALIKSLAKLTAGSEREVALRERIQAYREKEIELIELAEYMFAEAERLGIDRIKFAAFEKYIETLRIKQSFNAALFLSELEALNQLGIKTLIQTPAEAEFIELNETLQLMNLMVSLELDPQGYEKLIALEVADDWHAPLTKVFRFAKDYGMQTVEFSPSEALYSSLNYAWSFYSLAEQRNHAITKRVLQKIDKEAQPVSVLIMGGFHSPGLKELLSEHVGITVIVPLVGDENSKPIYQEAMKFKSKLWKPSSFHEVLLGTVGGK